MLHEALHDPFTDAQINGPKGPSGYPEASASHPEAHAQPGKPGSAEHTRPSSHQASRKRTDR